MDTHSFVLDKPITQRFDEYSRGEKAVFDKLFDHMELMISHINSKIPVGERPQYTVEILLIYNLTLFEASLEMLRDGYLGVSQSILRSAIENLIMSMYYFEFPEHERKYRDNTTSLWQSLKHKGYDQGWMDAALARVETEGKIFNIFASSSENSLSNLLTKNIMEEASKFLHQDFKFTESLVYGGSGKDKSIFVYGANLHGEEVLKNGFWKIIELLIINNIVFGAIFAQHIQKVDVELIRASIGSLNKWKKSYSGNI